MAHHDGMDVSGFLMVSHLADPETVVGQARLMESYGAHCDHLNVPGSTGQICSRA